MLLSDQLFLTAEHPEALDLVLQLAHVAWPVMSHQPIEGATAERLGALVPLGEAAEEVVDEEGDVVLSVTQRRDLERDHVEPIVEVFAEAALTNHLLEVPVRRRDDPHVHLAVFGGAHREEHPLLEHAQELHLERGRHVAYLVHEEGPTIGHLEEARLVAHRAGECAPAMTEELALEEIVVERAAVRSDEALIAPL